MILYEVTNKAGKIILIGSRNEIINHYNISETEFTKILEFSRFKNDTRIGINIKSLGSSFYLIDYKLNCCGIITKDEVMRDLKMTKRELEYYLSRQEKPTYKGMYWLVEVEQVIKRKRE